MIRRRLHRNSDDRPADFQKAVEMYKTFHQLEPRKIGAFSGLVIPQVAYLIGRADETRYRSPKWEGKNHDYYHEHEAGVGVFLPTPELGPPEQPFEKRQTPKWIVKLTTLARLGQSLGFDYTNLDGESLTGSATVIREPLRPCGSARSNPQEVEVRTPDLYVAPNGAALFVIERVERKRDREVLHTQHELITMFWGGMLTVTDRGIVH